MIDLIGSYECRVDVKGRFLLPVDLKKQLKEVLGDGFVIKRSIFYQCLELYPMSVWKKEVAKVNRLNTFVKKNTDFIRLFNVGVRIVDLNVGGKIQIPKDLVRYSGIAKNIVVASAGKRIEIWDKNQYEESIQLSDVDFSNLAEDVMGNVNIADDNEE